MGNTLKALIGGACIVIIAAGVNYAIGAYNVSVANAELAPAMERAQNVAAQFGVLPKDTKGVCATLFEVAPYERDNVKSTNDKMRSACRTLGYASL